MSIKVRTTGYRYGWPLGRPASLPPFQGRVKPRLWFNSTCGWCCADKRPEHDYLGGYWTGPTAAMAFERWRLRS